MLQFDAETTRLLDSAYLGDAFTRRRNVSFSAIRPGPDETILDIGCGNGLMTAELSRAVGSNGSVIGLDTSDEMLISARERCTAYPQAIFFEAGADQIPLADESVDKAVSVQVFEYIADLALPCREIARVLRPGGRVAIGDMHFGTLVWASDQPERMARMVESWSHHAAHENAPELLPYHLRNAGLVVEDVVPHAMTDHRLAPDGLARMMLILMESYAVSNGHVTTEDARDWVDEQKALAREGRFFFSMTHFVVVARKP